MRALAFDGACLRGKCEADPGLGYALMQRFAPVMIERLQATRLRLLDLYGDVAALSRAERAGALRRAVPRRAPRRETADT